jgi:hypothetical protein
LAPAAVLAVLNVPVYILIGRQMFEDWQDFWECVRFYLTPDLLSAIRGERWDDLWAELRLFFFLAVCAIVVGAETLVVLHVMGRMS